MIYIDLSVGETVDFPEKSEEIIKDIVNKTVNEEKLPFDVCMV